MQYLGILVGHGYGGNGIEHFNNEADALTWHLIVDGHIKIATLDHTHKPNQALHLAVHKHQHGTAHGARLAGDMGADSPGHRQPLRKGEGRLVIGQRRFIRETAGCIFQI